MSQYRVELWIENQGDMPDFYIQVQTNAPTGFYPQVQAALLMIGTEWVREVKVEVLSEGRWVPVFSRTNVSLPGSGRLCLNWEC